MEFNPSTPSSPFSAPTQIAPSTSSGGTLFTIGAAPPPHPGRPIKKLPNRGQMNDVTERFQLCASQDSTTIFIKLGLPAQKSHDRSKS